MRPILVVLIAAALVIAGATAFLAKRFVEDQTAQQQQQTPVIQTVEVVVAGRDLTPGTILKDTDLRYEKWPRQLVDPRFVVKSGNDDPRGQFIGSVVKRPVLSGEPMAAAMVFRQDDAGMLAGMLTPGMRAVSVGITPTNAASGFVLPNDRVDVVLTVELKVQAPDGGRVFSSEVILEDVRVLAVDTALAVPPSDKGGAPAIPGKTVTLEVTPKQAEKLITAGMMGSLSLVLRSTADGAIAEETPHHFTLSWEVAKVLQGDPQRLVKEASFSLKDPPPAPQAAPEPPPAETKPTQPPRALAPERSVKINRAGNVTTQTFSN